MIGQNYNPPPKKPTGRAVIVDGLPVYPADNPVLQNLLRDMKNGVKPELGPERFNEMQKALESDSPYY